MVQEFPTISLDFTQLWQGMTIRTARLPGAGNLLSRAGEDVSGLPDRASCYQFFGGFFN